MNDGGSAFPIEGAVDSGLHPERGMSLRDYFAAQAVTAVMQAISAGMKAGASCELKWPELAGISYAIADAMLAERAKERP